MQEVTLHLEQNTDFHTKEAFKTLRSNVEFCGSDVRVVARSEERRVGKECM